MAVSETFIDLLVAERLAVLSQPRLGIREIQEGGDFVEDLSLGKGAVSGKTLTRNNRHRIL